MLKSILSALGTGASIIGLAFSDHFPSYLKVAFCIIGILGIVYLVIESIKRERVNEIVCTSKAEIKREMQKLINTPDRICIMSRDLSWVDVEVEKDLCRRGSDILVFAREEIELTKRLKEHRVNVKYYGKSGFEPKTRFTILRYNRNNPQVAIANTQNSVRQGKDVRHIIYETSESGGRHDQWINSLALDMIDLCNRTSE